MKSILKSVLAAAVFVVVFVGLFLIRFPFAVLAAILGGSAAVASDMTPHRDGKDHGELWTDGRSNLSPERSA